MTQRRPYRRALALFFIIAVLFMAIFPLRGGLGSQLSGVTPAKAAGPITLTLPASTSVFLGSPFSFTATFKTSQTGYGPIIDFMIPAAITFNSAAYLGATLTTAGPLAAPTGATCASGTPAGHPYFVDNTNTPLVICIPTGYTFVAVQLPFGSVVPSMPNIDITINATLTNNPALIPSTLTIYSRAGYQFGLTPLNDWCCDPPVNTLTDASTVPTSWQQVVVTPLLVRISKTYDGPEGETATGPNFPRTYTVSAQIAPGNHITGLVLRDVMPAQHAFVSATTSAGGSITAQPAVNATGGTVQATFANASGTVTMTITFYAPKNIGANPLLDPVTGAPVNSTNNASATAGTWTEGSRPVPGLPIAAPGVGVANRSLAIQKGPDSATKNVGGTVTYTLHFQVSDFFSFGNIVITDLLGDAQTFVPNSAQIHVNFRDGSNTGTVAFPNANLDVDTSQYNAAAVAASTPIVLPTTRNGAFTNNGGTLLRFHVSDWLSTVTTLDGTAGNLRGGQTVNPAGTSGVTGTITFQATVNTNYRSAYLPQDSRVNHLDLLYNNVRIFGDVLSETTYPNPTTTPATTVTDDSASTVTINSASLSKSVYQVLRNGSPVSPNGSGVYDQLNPGDLVTYRVQYTMVTTSFELLKLNDYLPLPLFSLNSFNTALDAGSIGSAPPLNRWTYGSADNFHTLSGAPTPTVTTNTANNQLIWDYGTYQDPALGPSVIDLLFTVVISDQPYADALQLTNRATAQEGTTNSVDANQDGIVQIVVLEPDMRFFKGVVATSNTAPIYTPNGGASNIPAGPASITGWTAPGTAGARWTGGASASQIIASPINSSISGLRAGDTLTFALVLSNKGRGPGGAWNLTIQDTLPAGLINPTNMRIAFGGAPGTTINAVNATTGLPATINDLFTNFGGPGIRLVDNPLTGVCQAEAVSPNFSSIIITYDVSVDPLINANTTVTNDGQLTRYSSTPTGPNFLANGPLHAQANVTVIQPGVTKGIVETRRFGVPALPANPAATIPTPSVTIGEEVVYQVQMRFPKGTTPHAILQDGLPAGMALVPENSPAGVTNFSVRTTSYTDAACTAGAISPSPNLTTDVSGSASSDFSPVINSSNVSGGNSPGPGTAIVFNLGNVVNNNVVNTLCEQITIQYTAVVLNEATNLGGTTLINDAQLGFRVGTSGPYTFTPNSTTTTNIIEPRPTITKTILSGAGPYQAGDSVTYRLVVNNPSGGTNATAYNVKLQDAVSSPYLTITNVVNSSGVAPDAGTLLVDGAAPPTYPANGGTITATWAQLTPGQSSTIDVTVTVNIGVLPGQIIANTGEIVWQSLPGTPPFSPLVPAITNPTPNPSVPRTGDFAQPGSTTNYHATSTVNFSIQVTQPTKVVKATSKSFTSDTPTPSAVAIGEVVRYRMEVRIPRATIPNFSLRDTLPANLAMVGPNSSTNVAFVCSNIAQCITSSNATLDGTANLRQTGPVTGVNPTAVMPASLVTSAGGVITFDMGNLTNTATTGGPEFIVVEFDAVVLNNFAGNTRGTQINNTWAVWYGSPAVSQQTGTVASVRVNEPNLSANKSFAPAGPFQAGDTVTFTLRIRNTTNTNVTNAYNLDVKDTFDSFLTINRGGITTTVQAVGGGAATGCSATATTNVLASPPLAAQDFEGTVTCLAPGTEVLFTIPTTVNANVPANITITNALTSSADSLPDQTSDTAGVSTTPGAAGAGNGARQYTPGANTSITTAAPTIAKALTTPATTGYTIGDLISYDISVTVPRGVTRNLIINEQVPTGLRFENGVSSYSVITTGAPLAANFAGTLTNNPPTLNPASGTAVDGAGTMQFTFGDVTVPTGAANNERTFIVRVLLRVRNVAGNTYTTPTNFTNGAQLSYTPGTGSTPATLNASAPAAHVIEPNVVTTKTRQTATPAGGFQAGDVIQYVFTANNNGNSPAYNLVVTDTLPALASGPVVTYNAGSLTCANVTADATDPTRVVFTFTTPLAPAATTSCTYAVTVKTSVAIDGTYTNTVTAAYSSQSNTSTPENRNYTATPRTATFPVNPLVCSMLGAPASVTIGDRVTYTLTVNSPLGTIQNFSTVAHLPAGVIFDAASVVYSNLTAPGGGVVLSPAANDGSAAFTATWTFGDTVISTSPATITFQVIVANLPGNVSGGNVVSNADCNYTNAGGTPVTVTTTPNVTTPITEPVVTPTKMRQTATPAGGFQAGDVIQYTFTLNNPGNSPAYNIVVTDTLPAVASGPVVTYNAGSLTCANATADASDPTRIVFTFSGPLAPAATTTCSYTVTVKTNVVIDGTYTNSIVAVYHSQSSTSNPNDRTYTTTPPRTATFPVNPLVCSMLGTPNAATIGDRITYTLTVNSPRGTVLNFSTVAHLPAGVIFDASSVVYSNLTAPGGGVVLSPAANDGSAAFTATWTFGDTVISTSPATITFDVIVANVPGNVSGGNLSANSDCNYTNAGGTPVTVTTTPNVQTNIQEPAVVTTKTRQSTPPFQAGDTVIYRISFTNNGNSPAYRLVATDTLPALAGPIPLTQYNAGSLTCTQNGSPFANITASATATQITFTFTAPLGTGAANAVTCDYTVQVLQAIPIDSSATAYVNTLNATYHSQASAATPQDRTYNTTPVTASLGILPPTCTLNGTPNTSVRIGERITFTLTLTSPLGTLQNLSTIAHVPQGLIFDAASVQYTNITGPTGGPTVSAPNDGSAAVTVTWTFGNTVVTASPITIQYQAIVANIANNTAGKTLSTNMDCVYDNASGTTTTLTTANIQVIILEPTLTLAKAFNPAAPTPPIQSGTALPYRLTITHPGGTNTSDANNVRLVDTLPSNLTPPTVAGVTVTPSNGATVQIVGQSVIVTIASIAPNATVTVDFTATVNSTVSPGDTIANNATVYWSSLPTAIDSSSSTPVTGQRTGGGNSAGGSNNNYVTTSATITVTAAGLNLQKAVYQITPSTGVPSTTNATIGQIVTYDVRGQFPTGSSSNINFVDLLPAGMSYINSSFQVLSTVAASAGSPLALTTDFAGAPGLAAPTISTATVGGRMQLTAAFGAATTTIPTGSAGTDVIFRFQAQVLDVAGNVTGTTLVNADTNNNVTLSVTNNNTGASASVQTPVTVTVIEPTPTITKTMTPDHVGVGDKVTVLLVYRNTGNSPAFDSVVSDGLDATRFGSIANVSITDGNNAAVTDFTFSSATSGGFTTVNYTANTTVGLPVYGGNPANERRFTFSAIILPPSPWTNTGTGADLTIANQGTVTTKSLPGNVATTGARTYTATDTKNLVVTAPDLAITKSVSPTGPVAPNAALTYTLVVTNSNLIVARNVKVVDTLPAGVTEINTAITTGSCSVSSVATPPQVVTCQLGDMALNASVTITIQVSVNATATGNLDNSATVSSFVTRDQDGNPLPVPPPTPESYPQGDRDASPTPTHQNTATASNSVTGTTALSILKTSPTTTYTPGQASQTLTYTITATNTGTIAITGFGANIVDTFPAQLLTTPPILWTCAVTPVAAGNACQNASGTGNLTTANAGFNLLPNASVTFTVTAAVDTAATGNIVNTATVNGPNNFTASSTFTHYPSTASLVNLSITKTDNVTTYTPGGPLTYVVVVTNNGTNAVTGATMNDTFPATLTNVTWTCAVSTVAPGNSCPASGSGNIGATINLLPGASATFTINVTVDAAATGQLTNTATVLPPTNSTNTNPNNTATDTDNPASAPSVDLSIQKSANALTYTPGGTLRYTLVISNNSSQIVNGATVTDTFPAQVTGATWTCSASAGSACTLANGTGNINTTVNLAANGQATFVVDVTISGTATGDMLNSAKVQPPVGTPDSNPNNNTSSVTTPIATITPPTNVDLSITKAVTPATYTDNGTLTYTIVARNNSATVAVVNATVTDTFPAQLTGVTWTCAVSTVATGNACPASGAGNINAQISLLPGASATFTVTATVLNGTAATNAVITNTATIQPPTGSTNTNPNTSATVNTPPQGTNVTDLAITKVQTLPNPLTAGGAMTYVLVVTNNGPTDVTGATVTDVLPDSIRNLITTTWTCSVSNSGTGFTNGCNQVSGVGSINTTVNLAGNGSTATFTIQATLPAGVPAIANTATVQPPTNVVDTNPTNNSATVTGGSAVNLSVAGTTDKSYTAGKQHAWTCTVTNNDSLPVVNATFIAIFPPQAMNVSWTATGPTGPGNSLGATSGTGNITIAFSLAAGQSAVFQAVGDIPSATTGTITTTCQVLPPTGTTNGNPNSSVQLNSNPVEFGIGVADPVLNKYADPTLALPGEDVTFVITARNQGGTPAPAVIVRDNVPDVLTVISAQTEQGTFTISGNIVTFNLGILNPGQTVTMRIVARLRPDIVPPADFTNTANLDWPGGTTRTASAKFMVIKGELPRTGEHPADSPAADTSLPIAALVLALVFGVTLFIRRRNR